jgi:hypothetical protein
VTSHQLLFGDLREWDLVALEELSRMTPKRLIIRDHRGRFRLAEDSPVQNGQLTVGEALECLVERYRRDRLTGGAS